MAEPRWLTRLAIESLQHDQIVEHGGLPGLREEGALESALERPRHRWLYDETTDLAELAAAYAFGITRNHPFADGNKRMGFIALAVFLDLNGVSFEVDDDDVVTTMRQLAADDLGEKGLADWIRAHSKPSRG